MKNDDILLWGGLAVLGYFLLKPKPPVVPVTTSSGQVVPVVQTTSSAPANNATNNLLTSINNIVKQITQPSNAVVQVQTPLTATGTNDIITPLQTVNTPIYSKPVVTLPATTTYASNDSLYQMFENKDYPGALAGYIEEEMYS